MPPESLWRMTWQEVEFWLSQAERQFLEKGE